MTNDKVTKGSNFTPSQTSNLVAMASGVRFRQEQPNTFSDITIDLDCDPICDRLVSQTIEEIHDKTDAEGIRIALLRLAATFFVAGSYSSPRQTETACEEDRALIEA